MASAGCLNLCAWRPATLLLPVCVRRQKSVLMLLAGARA